MSDLAALIRKAFVAGKTGITIWRKSDGTGYQANVRHEDGSWCVMMHDMPDEAVEAALTQAIESRRPTEMPAQTPDRSRRREIEDLI